MSRMIDADAIRYEPMLSERGNGQYVDVMVAYKDQIDDIPTIEERKTGKWEQIEVSYFVDMDDETKTGMAIASMFCPRCKRYHNEVYLYGNPTFGVNFCPNCGAKMEGEQP